MSIIKLIVKFYEDTFGLKKRICSIRNKHAKTFLAKIYSNYLMFYGRYIGYTARIDSKLTTPHGILGIFIS